MSETAIRVENISKRYRIGSKGQTNDTFAGTLASVFRSPFSNLRRLRRMSKFDKNELEADDIFWALRDVSFEVKRGEVMGIIGRNGAGKSTLLKILSRITEPTNGRIEIRGRVSSLLEVGTGFHPELTGSENIYLNGTILGLRKTEIDSKYDEIIDFSGVEKFIQTPVKFYSSGMRMRLAFSVAAHLEPEILLIDEVLAVGDADFQKKCLGKMKDVSETGRTVLFVSHNLDAVVNLCELALWIEHGEIKCLDKALDVVTSYLSTDDSVESNDLTDTTNRRGEYQCIRLVRLLIQNGLNGNFVTQGPFSFEVECELDLHLAKQVSLGFIIRDNLDRRVFATHMNQQQYYSVQQNGIVTFRVMIQQLPLVPGVYSLSLTLASGTHDLDIVDNAIRFNVMWNKELGLAYPPRANWGPAFMNVDWDVSEKNE